MRRRKHLQIPPIDREMLTSLLDAFERVMAQATHPHQKDLLRRKVKKALIHDRSTIEVWCA